ncbi:hypothetical protein ACMFMG_006731 [Clarireedia jacksonii]
MAEDVPSQEQLSFLLSTSIFTAYPGPPSAPIPTNQEAKLNFTIQSLNRQHRHVRENILATLVTEKERLILQARQELLALGYKWGQAGSSRLEQEENERRGGLEKEIDELVKVVKHSRARKDARSEEYEYVVGVGQGRKEQGEGSRDNDGDVVMGEDENVERERESAYEICRRVDAEVRELAERGTRELESYDAHAESVVRGYKELLNKGKTRIGSDSGVVELQKGGASGSERSSAIQSPMDAARESDIRRLSNGMPVVVENGGKGAKTGGSIEALARRDSAK